MDIEKLKPFYKIFIKDYYYDLDNGAGGNLHIILDDGNIDKEDIKFCREQCEEKKDEFGLFLCELLDCFSTGELEKMYEDNWWGIRELHG